MGKADAEALADAGFKYLGTSYQKMDCQAFVEQCLRDIEIPMDLKGSNAWYRKIMAEGWVGSPEQCRKLFGRVPKGALLFIHVYDGGEEERGYHDGLGNAKHIGIKTGSGQGAIHSSESRDQVAESKFKDKTISGGWNVVGLWRRLSYGADVDAVLEGLQDGSVSADDEKEVEKVEKAVVWAEDGGKVKLRSSSKPGTAGYGLYVEIPVGTAVEVVERGDTWSRIKCGSRNGWMKTEFLAFDGQQVEPGQETEEPADDPDTVEITLTMTRQEAQLLIRFADSLGWKLAQAAGGVG